ncbi:MAG: flagellar assembly peptidoglycan hydrolase FlgJ [Rhodocyclaceae bacterium]|nr:flagellar assembly peptidoglycan hydrolase FlgJ [Rhodocyclaceae bacterium]
MKADEIAASRFVLDMKTAQDLRTRMQQDPKAGLQEAARQFEGMFLQMVMKSMRDATPADGPLNSDATRFYTSVLDQQLASQLGASGQLGFARLIEKQLGRYGATAAENSAVASMPVRTIGGDGIPAGAIQGAARVFSAGASETPAPQVPTGPVSQSAQDFAARVWSHAVDASRSTGVPAHFLVAHAALESGWGKSEIRRSDGSTTHNLFGIKAGRGWQGDTVETMTTEYVNGEARQVREKFRAYGSYAEAFRDYARLLTSNPRFSGVLGQQDGTSFARSLQQSGYATDPMYADKLARIINGGTLRQALSG